MCLLLDIVWFTQSLESGLVRLIMVNLGLISFCRMGRFGRLPLELLMLLVLNVPLVSAMMVSLKVFYVSVVFVIRVVRLC